MSGVALAGLVVLVVSAAAVLWSLAHYWPADDDLERRPSGRSSEWVVPAGLLRPRACSRDRRERRYRWPLENRRLVRRSTGRPRP